MRKKTALISNLCIAAVLVGLGVAVFTTDLSNVFLSVGAPLYNGSRDGQNVSLMFVVEDEATNLPEIMQVLKDNDTDATFFVGGKWASDNRSLVMDIAKDFEIANHGYNNSNMPKLSSAKQRDEIKGCHTMIKSITAGTPLNPDQGNEVVTGIEMKLFSPPHGEFNKTTLKHAEKLGYKTVIWSKDATTGIIFDVATTGIQSGDLVMLTPSAATLEALPNILTKYNDLGFDIVKVSEFV